MTNTANAPANAPVKLSVNLSREVVEALKDIAQEQGTTVTEALRKAISTEKFLRDAAKEGAKVLIEDKDKSVKQLVLR